MFDKILEEGRKLAGLRTKENFERVVQIRMEKILNSMEKDKLYHSKEVAEMNDISDRTARRYMKKLMSENCVERVRIKKDEPGRAYRYKRVI